MKKIHTSSFPTDISKVTKKFRKSSRLSLEDVKYTTVLKNEWCECTALAIISAVKARLNDAYSLKVTIIRNIWLN